MTPLSLLYSDPSIGSDEVDSIGDAYAREERRARRETLAAVDRFDAWRRKERPGARCMHITGTAETTPGREVVAIAYSASGFVDVKGYGADWSSALEDLARAGAARGVW